MRNLHVLRYGTKTGRSVVRDFAGCDHSEKTFWGARNKKRIQDLFWVCGLSEKTGRFFGQEFFGLERFVVRNISRRAVLWPGIVCELGTYVSGSLRPVHVRSKL